MSKENSRVKYEESLKEILEIQIKIKDHQDGKAHLDDYVVNLKRLQFLRNSIRGLNKSTEERGDDE